MAGRGQGNQNYPYNNPYAGSYAQNYQQQGQYGYGGGGWEGDYYEEYQGNENLDQDDFDNLAEIERAIGGDQGAGGYDYDDDDDAALNELEGEMQRMEFNAPGQRQSPSHRQPYQGGGGRGGGGGGGGRGGGAYVPAGAMPSHNGVLSAHAKEFWFPECRNCDCCKGFKHGCDCCKNGVDTCTKPGCVSTEHTSQVAADLASKSSGASAGAGASTSSPAAAASSGAPRSPAAAAAPAAAAGEVCKFFLTGGCRFGASCRFVHPGSSQAGGASGSGSSGPVCQFFLSGNCMYGDKCRNAHVKPAAAAPPAAPAAAAASTPAVPPPAPAEGDSAEKN